MMSVIQLKAPRSFLFEYYTGDAVRSATFEAALVVLLTRKVRGAAGSAH